MARSHRPWRRPVMRSRARDPSVPCPALRSFDRSATSASSSPRRTTSSGPPSRTPACAASANVVRLDLPREEPGDEPDDRYRRAARTLAAWRSDGTLHKDPHPSIYVYEQTYRVPGTDVDGRSEASSRGSGSSHSGPGRACFRTSGRSPAAREDRYKLLRATGVNTSPVVVLYDDRDRWGRAVLEGIAGRRGRRRSRRRRRRGPSPLGVPGRRRRGFPVTDPLARGGPGGRRHDRRRTPPLRDRAPLPRRAPDELGMRGVTGLRLRPHVVPRDHRRG